MCQRYVLPDQFAAEREFLPVTAWWKFTPKFNVAPGQNVPAIRLHEGSSEGVMLRWGLIPAWFEGEPGGRPAAAVRACVVERSRLARTAWAGGQRCILPVAGYYTWRMTPDRYRQPYFVGLTERSIVGLAAIWDRWVSDDDDVIESCAVLCVPVSSLLQDKTGDRSMPAILRRRDYEQWLQGSPQESASLLRAYDAGRMYAYPVSPRINSAIADDPGLIRVTA